MVPSAQPLTAIWGHKSEAAGAFAEQMLVENFWPQWISLPTVQSLFRDEGWPLCVLLFCSAKTDCVLASQYLYCNFLGFLCWHCCLKGSVWDPESIQSYSKESQKSYFFIRWSWALDLFYYSSPCCVSCRNYLQCSSANVTGRDFPA